MAASKEKVSYSRLASSQLYCHQQNTIGPLILIHQAENQPIKKEISSTEVTKTRRNFITRQTLTSSTYELFYDQNVRILKDMK